MGQKRKKRLVNCLFIISIAMIVLGMFLFLRSVYISSHDTSVDVKAVVQDSYVWGDGFRIDIAFRHNGRQYREWITSPTQSFKKGDIIEMTINKNDSSLLENDKPHYEYLLFVLGGFVLLGFLNQRRKYPTF